MRVTGRFAIPVSGPLNTGRKAPKASGFLVSVRDWGWIREVGLRPADYWVAGVCAPFIPTAVIDTDVLPAHQPSVKKRKRRAPTRTAVERNGLVTVDACLTPHRFDVTRRAHGAIGVLEVAHAVHVAVGTRMTPARAINVAHWCDVAVA